MTLGWPESEFLVNDRHRFVLCPIPKVASSSLKQWFLTTIGYRPDAPDWPARPHVFLSEWNRSRPDEIPGDYLRVAFVRDPMRRLVSAYLQKFVLRWDVEESPARPVIRAVCKTAGRVVDYEVGISFREFVAHVDGTEPAQMDVHWRPQHFFFGDRWPDVIGNVETIDRDLQSVCRKIGLGRCDLFETLRLSYRNELLPGGADWASGALRALDRFPHWASFVDEEIAGRVARIYKDDYRRLGYSYPAAHHDWHRLRSFNNASAASKGFVST